MLQRVPVAESDKLPMIPRKLESYEAFVTNSVVDGVTMMEVNLGYFATRQEAELVLNQSKERFPKAEIIDLQARRDEVLKSVAATATTPTAAPPTAASGAGPTDSRPLTEIDTRADKLMSDAKTALSSRANTQAIDLLNQLLLLPPNKDSQEAQELIGLAWERVGDARRARVEYELYLRLFPEGEGADRVRQRLASLEDSGPVAPSSQASASAGETRAAQASHKFTGNIAQYY